MKLNRDTRLLLIGLSPLAAGLLMSYVPGLIPTLGIVLSIAFLILWYKVGSDTVMKGKNVKKSMVLLNAPALVFLVSAFVHEIILRSYMGIIGRFTQNFYLPMTLLSVRVTSLLGQAVTAFTGEPFVSRVLYADAVAFILLVICFILGVKAAEKKKY